MRSAIILLVALAGCAAEPEKVYRDTTGSSRPEPTLHADENGCAYETAAIGRSDLYEACMRARGWQRMQ